MDRIRIPAIRSQMGIWVYYVSALSFDEVNEYVRPINDELHKSNLLCEMIQRSITDNYKSIARYIETQEERFFNALILAVYDGQPMWNEIRIDDEGLRENVDMGVLTLSGEEKIFPVDGQHRVEGIKQALKDNPELGTEKVPVIFIGHSKDEEGMQRTRRMFSTLNRYAKPVSMRDIIALDEDDIVAIVSRELIDNEQMFGDKKILDTKTKSLPESNDTAFTSIITYYECNTELLWLMIQDKEVVGLDGKSIKGRRKMAEYIRHRPDDETIKQFVSLCKEYWIAIFDQCPGFFFQDNNKVGRYRDKNGGHIFFRPVALYPFTRAVVRIHENGGESFRNIISRFPEEILWLKHRLWKKIIWDSEQGKMITSNKTLTELLFLYIYDKNILTDKERQKIYKDWKSIYDYLEEDMVEENIDAIIAGEEYI